MDPMSDKPDAEESASGPVVPQTVTFMAAIALSQSEIDDAQGDLAQAVQNEVGFSGIKVIGVISAS
jgi:hypothetical protein